MNLRETFAQFEKVHVVERTEIAFGIAEQHQMPFPFRRSDGLNPFSVARTDGMTDAHAAAMQMPERFLVSSSISGSRQPASHADMREALTRFP